MSPALDLTRGYEADPEPEKSGMRVYFFIFKVISDYLCHEC